MNRGSYLDAFVLSHRTEDADNVLNYLKHVKRRTIQFEIATFDLAKIMQIMNEALQEFQLAPHYGTVIDRNR